MMRKPFGATLAVLAGLLLAGCNITDANFGVTPKDQAAAAQSAGAAVLSDPRDAQNAAARLHIAPVVGSTVAAVTPLSRRLAAIAPANGLALVGAADPARTHIVKGYFSAFSEGGQTTLVFVWDVFDPAGVRLHRIQGSQVIPGAAADPWSIVPPATMEAAADKLVADFNIWRGAAAAAVPVTAVPPAATVQPLAAPLTAPLPTPSPGSAAAPGG
jgi:hypothetical protein